MPWGSVLVMTDSQCHLVRTLHRYGSGWVTLCMVWTNRILFLRAVLLLVMVIVYEYSKLGF